MLFDLDGTLTDPKVGIINSILYALEKLNIKEERIDELDAFIGPPLRDSFVSRYNFSDDLAEKAIAFYREYFSTKGLFENEIYQEIPDLLDSLFTAKIQLFVATSKPTHYSDKIMKHFNIDKYFVDVIGSNLDNTRADKTEIISHIVSVHRLKTENSLMIGDRKYDLIGAKNNSMKAIGVTYGYGSVEELSMYDSALIVNSVSELKSAILENRP